VLWQGLRTHVSNTYSGTRAFSLSLASARFARTFAQHASLMTHSIHTCIHTLAYSDSRTHALSRQTSSSKYLPSSPHTRSPRSLYPSPSRALPLNTPHSLLVCPQRPAPSFASSPPTPVLVLVSVCGCACV